MKLISWNVNGLRAAHRKGFLDWFEEQKADIIGLQEIKVRREQLYEDLLNPGGYWSHFYSAQKPGYSGVAILSLIHI